MNEVDVIKGARAVIERGWHKGNMQNPDQTAFCIVGALEQVDPQALYRESAAEDAIAETIRHAYPDAAAEAVRGPRRLAVYFNDYVARSSQDVLDVLDKTIAELGGLA